MRTLLAIALAALAAGCAHRSPAISASPAPAPVVEVYTVCAHAIGHEVLSVPCPPSPTP